MVQYVISTICHCIFTWSPKLPKDRKNEAEQAAAIDLGSYRTTDTASNTTDVQGRDWPVVLVRSRPAEHTTKLKNSKITA